MLVKDGNCARSFPNVRAIHVLLTKTVPNGKKRIETQLAIRAPSMETQPYVFGCPRNSFSRCTCSAMKQTKRENPPIHVCIHAMSEYLATSVAFDKDGTKMYPASNMQATMNHSSRLGSFAIFSSTMAVCFFARLDCSMSFFSDAQGKCAADAHFTFFSSHRAGGRGSVLGCGPVSRNETRTASSGGVPEGGGAHFFNILYTGYKKKYVPQTLRQRIHQGTNVALRRPVRVVVASNPAWTGSSLLRGRVSDRRCSTSYTLNAQIQKNMSTLNSYLFGCPRNSFSRCTCILVCFHVIGQIYGVFQINLRQNSRFTFVLGTCAARGRPLFRCRRVGYENRLYKVVAIRIRLHLRIVFVPVGSFLEQTRRSTVRRANDSKFVGIGIRRDFQCFPAGYQALQRECTSEQYLVHLRFGAPHFIFGVRKMSLGKTIGNATGAIVNDQVGYFTDIKLWKIRIFGLLPAFCLESLCTI